MAKNQEVLNNVTNKDAAAVILYTAEQATQCALDTIQVLGGNGYINEYELKKIFNHFIDVGLPTKDNNMYNSEIFTIIQKDKKNLRNDINLILLKKIGKAHFSRGNSIKKIKKNIY